MNRDSCFMRAYDSMIEDGLMTNIEGAKMFLALGVNKYTVVNFSQLSLEEVELLKQEVEAEQQERIKLHKKKKFLKGGSKRLKLIFLDIDGTLTRPGENTPPDSAVDAITKARAKGHKVFLCTGRNPDMLRPLLRYQFDGFISCAGGYVAVGEKYDEILYNHPMTNEERDTALRTLHNNGVFCTIEAEKGSWGDENLGDFLSAQGEGNSELERWRKALASNLGIKPMNQYDGSPIYKVVIMCQNMSQLDEAKAALGDRYNFVMQEIRVGNTTTHCINGEVINKAFNKGLGVEIICKRFNVPISDTVGFGDSMNDLEMIQTVGFSVCMANGSEALQKLSDMVCESVSDDGLAKAFAHLQLI